MPRLRPRKSLRKGKRDPKHPDARWRRWVLRTLITRDRGRCRYCGKQVNLDESPRAATIDHIVPRSAGGLDTVENLALACARCNAEKADSVAVELGT